MMGERAGEVELPDEVFNVPMNAELLHQAATVLRSRQHRHLAHTKQRGEVRGGGRKPWRQKGTGRARHGSIRSPLWRGGGTVFGPRKDRTFAGTLPDAMRKRAFAVALSQKVRDGEVVVLDAVEMDEPKTKRMASALDRVIQAAGVETGARKRPPSMTLATAHREVLVERATRNLPYARNRTVRDLTVLDILGTRYLLFPKDAIALFVSRAGTKKKAS